MYEQRLEPRELTRQEDILNDLHCELEETLTRMKLARMELDELEYIIEQIENDISEIESNI